MLKKSVIIFLIFGLFSALAIPRDHADVLKMTVPRFRVEGNLKKVLGLLQEETIRSDPDVPSLNIVYLPPKDKKAYDHEKVLKFDFANLKVLQIVKTICEAENLIFRIDRNSLFISHPDRKDEFIRTRIYSLSLNEFKHFSDNDFLEYLQSHGVVFGKESKAFFLKRVNKLVVKNTIFELNKIQNILIRSQVNEKIASLENKVNSLNVLDSKAESKILKELELIKSMLTEKSEPAPLDDGLKEQLSTVIPKTRLERRSLEFVLDFLRRACRDLSEDGEAINFAIKVNPEKNKQLIDLDMNDATLSEVLIQTLKKLDLSFKVADGVVIVCEKKDSYTTGSYDVPKEFTEIVFQDFEVNCQKFLTELGIFFPIGAHAKISIEKNKVLFTNDILEHQKLKGILKDFEVKK